MSHPNATPNSKPDPTSGAGTGLWRGLLVAVSFPWAVHTLVVGSSAVGLRPLSSRVAAFAILVTSAALSVAISHVATKRAKRARDERGEAFGLAKFLSQLLTVAAGIAFAVALLTSIALPIVAYDAIAYRLPTIASWLDVGRIAWVPTDDPVRNGYPMGQEAVSAVFAAMTGTMRFVAATSFVHVAAGAIAIWLFCEESGIRRPFARASGAAFVLVPMVLLNASSGYVDAAFAGAVVSLLCMVALAATAEPLHAGVVAAAGMAAANVVSLKGTGLPFLAIAFATTVWFARPKHRLPHLAPALAFAAPGAFWTVRNIVHTGNPIWPVEFRFLGRTILPGIGSADQILDVAHNTPPSLASAGEAVRILSTWLELNGPARDFDDRMAGLGIAWVLVAVPAVVAVLVAFVRHRNVELRAPVIVIALTAACFALQPMRWWPRYAIWVWGAGALSLGVVAERWARRERGTLLLIGFSTISALMLTEAALGLWHANGADLVSFRHGPAYDPRYARNAISWVDPKFWGLGLDEKKIVCRGDWKPGTDNGNLDGVFAQLTPRPRVHIVSDDSGNWQRVRKGFREAGCTDLLLFRGSPVLPLAVEDDQFSVEAAVAFDPLFVVRPRAAVLVGTLDRRLP